MLSDKPAICLVLIGRENDLQILDSLLLQSCARNGQVALITGEAGIGESRLVREARVRVPQGTLVLDLFRNLLVTQ
ncbi:MAG: hypothetical protein ACM3XO_22540 [Bacteroidota bacterium]